MSGESSFGAHRLSFWRSGGLWAVPPRGCAGHSSLAGKAENLGSSFNSATYSLSDLECVPLPHGPHCPHLSYNLTLKAPVNSTVLGPVECLCSVQRNFPE